MIVDANDLGQEILGFSDDLKEKEFRNKYLLGTLTSLVLSLVIFVVYKAI